MHAALEQVATGAVMAGHRHQLGFSLWGPMHRMADAAHAIAGGRMIRLREQNERQRR